MFKNKLFISLLVILLFLGTIWIFTEINRLKSMSSCLVRLGGTHCYNEQGTPIGTTPDAWAYEHMTDEARTQSFCKATLTAVSSHSPPASIVISPFVFVGNRPSMSLSPSEGFIIFCGQSIEILRETKNNEGRWYEVKTSDDFSGWISERDWGKISSSATIE